MDHWSKCSHWCECCELLDTFRDYDVERGFVRLNKRRRFKWSCPRNEQTVAEIHHSAEVCYRHKIERSFFVIHKTWTCLVTKEVEYMQEINPKDEIGIARTINIQAQMKNSLCLSKRFNERAVDSLEYKKWKHREEPDEFLQQNQSECHWSI